MRRRLLLCIYCISFYIAIGMIVRLFLRATVVCCKINVLKPSRIGCRKCLQIVYLL